MGFLTVAGDVHGMTLRPRRARYEGGHLLLIFSR
jgi:hypothetical protein